MRKYVTACNGDTRRAMTLYRYNVKLSQEMFALVSYFEVALRNAIDRQLKQQFGNDWLRDFILPGGIFYNDSRVEKTRKIIVKAYDELMRKGNYKHSKLRNRIAHHEPICLPSPLPLTPHTSSIAMHAL